jgi:hypothetical protein
MFRRPVFYAIKYGLTLDFLENQLILKQSGREIPPPVVYPKKGKCHA